MDDHMQLGEGLGVRLPTDEGKRFGIVGKSGSGKTNTMLILAKALLEAGWLVWIIEPMNNFRRLRDAGLPIIVAGGRESANIQLTAANAAALARLSFDERVSMVLDMSFIKDDMSVLVPFLETVWEERILRQPEDGPFVRTALFVDEADLYIPQNGKTEVSDLILDMGKRGRQLHLSMAIASQRPASMDKNFLTQSQAMFYHKLKGNDIVALKEDIGLPERPLREMMRKFAKGETLIVADADMVNLGEEDYLRGHVWEWTGAQTATTTSEGVQRNGAIDPELLERIRMAIAEKDDAPKAQASAAQPQTIIQRVEVPVISDDQIDRLETVAREAIHKGEELLTFGREILSLIGKAHKPALVQVKPPPSIKPVQVPIPIATPQTIAGELNGVEGSMNLNGGPLKILQKLAEIYPTRLTKVQIGNICDYTASGGTFGKYWGILKRNGFVVEQGNDVFITQEGFDYLGLAPRDIPADSAELIEMWCSVLGAGERKLLTTLIDVYPQSMTPAELGEVTGYTASGGTFGKYLGILKRNDLVRLYGGEVMANSETLLLDEPVTA